ncbi:MAG: phosphatidylglycerol lysyltransferase domain-containing protein, partial [Acetobacteraceae bacterium]
LIGAGLLLMAIGLSHRVNLAWGLTIVLLLGGAIYAATRDGLVWLTVALTLTILVLAPFRRCFYRHASLLSGPLQGTSAMSLIALLLGLIGLALMRHQAAHLDNDAWWAVILSSDMPMALRATVGLSVALALVALWLLIRPGRVRVEPWNEAMQARFHRLAGVCLADADGIVFGEADRAGIAFRRIGRLLVGLGDPAGPHDDQVSAIWRFHDLARQEGLGPTVWRAGPGLLKVYADLGMTALALGPDGMPLPETPDVTPPAEHYLVGVPERDLAELLPLLEELTRERAVAAPTAVAA